eukprot:s385_g28.t1
MGHFIIISLRFEPGEILHRTASSLQVEASDSKGIGRSPTSADPGNTWIRMRCPVSRDQPIGSSVWAAYHGHLLRGVVFERHLLPGTADLMDWAMSMALMYGPPPGWEDSWEGGGKGKSNGCGNGCGYGKGKSTEPMTAPSCKVFVGGLPKVISEASVRQSFAHFGNIIEVKMMLGAMGESKGYCFITFSNIQEANAVLANYDYNTVEGKWVDCKPASQGMGGPKAGDWTCPSCGDNVFAWRTECNRCGTPRVGQMTGGATGSRPGDWLCPACGELWQIATDLCFSSRESCKRCGQAKPGGAKRMGSKPGDWTCPQCGDLVFAFKNACSLCGTPKPAETRSFPPKAAGKPTRDSLVENSDPTREKNTWATWGGGFSDGPAAHGDVLLRDENREVCQQQFEIFLVKSSSSTLGIDVDLLEGNAMLVQAVQETGVLSEWNRRNPSHAVQKHDRIVKVNGVEGNADLMAKKCREDSDLQLTICRSRP